MVVETVRAGIFLAARRRPVNGVIRRLTGGVAEPPPFTEADRRRYAPHQ
jgi:hypothetical protein